MEQPIYSYTAEQAIEDGILVDVSSMAKEAGFTWPVRITRGVHDLCTPPKTNKIQSYQGRLWDVLWMAYCKIKMTKDKEEGLVPFKVKLGPKLYILWACIDGTSGPAIHIMLPSEY